MLDRLFDNFIGFILVLGIGIIVSIYSMIAVTECAQLPSSIAKIEQLRKDIKRVDSARAEDVMGQVTSWNQNIASYKALNKTWYSDLLVPDEWDKVEFIEP